MDKLKNDERFKDALTNPKYFKANKKDTKVKLGKRFERILTDKDFTLKYTVDSKGRPLKESANEDLKKYYQYSESEEDSGAENVPTPKKPLTKTVINTEKKDELSESEGDDEDEETSSSSSSSDDDDSDIKSSSEDDAEEIVHTWGELDHGTDMTEDATARLAICNMDWDRIKAVDLLILFNSFKPSNGSISSISIYPSEFGLERMRQEDRYGPQELKAVKKEDEKQYNERLRKYQLNRLKYFYGVITCDSAQTADSVYNNCNNIEFEASATVMDLRFIPDDMLFDHAPSDTATSLPPPGDYKPSPFVNSALHQSKVNLTWDETPLERTKVLNQDPKKVNVDDDDRHFNKFIASASEDEGGDDEGGDDEGGDDEGGDDEGSEEGDRGENEEIEVEDMDDGRDENKEDEDDNGGNDGDDDQIQNNLKSKISEQKIKSDIKILKVQQSNKPSRDLNSKKNEKLINKKKKIPKNVAKNKNGDGFDDQIKKYRDLLKEINEQEEGGDDDDDDVDMEVTWKTGTMEAAEEVLEKKKRSTMTSFEKYHEKRKMKRKMKKLNKSQSKNEDKSDLDEPPNRKFKKIETLSESAKADLELLMMDKGNMHQFNEDEDNADGKKMSKRQKMKKKMMTKKIQKQQAELPMAKVTDERFSKMYTDEDFLAA